MDEQAEPRSGRARSRNYSRQKGHRAEQEYAQKFRDLGFHLCKTSREASRLLDACKVDLYGLPFNFQIKSGYKQRRVKADETFREMKELLQKNFDKGEPIHDRPKILIQKIDAYTDENQLVTMRWKDFIMFLNCYIKANELQTVPRRSQGAEGCRDVHAQENREEKPDIPY